MHNCDAKNNNAFDIGPGGGGGGYSRNMVNGGARL